jgi:hypothetical protein
MGEWRKGRKNRKNTKGSMDTKEQEGNFNQKHFIDSGRDAPPGCLYNIMRGIVLKNNSKAFDSWGGGRKENHEGHQGPHKDHAA